MQRSALVPAMNQSDMEAMEECRGWQRIGGCGMTCFRARAHS